MGLGCTILLDNAEKVFFPGQVVSGKLRITITNKPKIIVKEGIVLECSGSADVDFSHRGTYQSTQSDHYGAKEEYFKFVAPLLVPTIGEHLILPVGNHEFLFKFDLPMDIPSSYGGHYGHVNYHLMASIERICKDIGYGNCCVNYIPADFYVNTIVDLNTIPQAKMPVSLTETKTIGFCCCKSGPITAKVWLNQTGYVPGQTIYFNAQVENLSKKQMLGSRVQLIEHGVFYARNGTAKKSIYRIISEKYHGPFNETDVWSNEPLIVPGIAPSTLPNCNIIHITYWIQLVVDVDGSKSSYLTLPIPILIGNIPISNNTLTDATDDNDDNQNTTLMQANDLIDHQNIKLQVSSIKDHPDLPSPRYHDGFKFPDERMIFPRNRWIPRYVTF